MEETLPRGVNAEFLEELGYVEELLPLYQAVGSPVEFWEALCIVQADRMMVSNEIDHLAATRREGKPASMGATHARILNEVRQAMGTLAGDIRAFLDRLPLGVNGPTREMLLGVILITADSRSEMRRWMSNPVRHQEAATEGLKDLCVQMDAYRRELRRRRGDTVVRRALPAAGFSVPPSLPPGVDGDILASLRFVDRFRELFDIARARMELWEVLSLRTEDPLAAGLETAQLLQLKDGGESIEFNERAIRLFEKLLAIRAEHAALAASLRRYFSRLPMGHYSADTMELALGFILASAEGRRRAAQWLETPDQYLREAAIRVEGVIGRAQKYQAVLRTPAPAAP